MSATQPARKRGAKAETPMTRELIVDTAYRLIEERGLEGFSMRSLATELGVFPATLYWHVGDRGQLLGLVEYRWIQDVELPDHLTDWREWMLELGRRYRRNAFAHPDVARLASMERARNNESLAIPDAIIGKLAELGLGDELVHVFNSLMGAVRGFVLMELAPRAETGPDGRDVVEAELRGIDPERFPHLSAHFGEMGDKALSVRWSDAADSPLDESFEYLMRLLLDGIEARVKKTRKRS
jgi:TetR/AcrR family transcriptional regulator, tetracycline repressor protein